MTNERTTNRMGVIPVDRLMLSMGIPMIISMMLQALYNIVDSAFVSNIPGCGEAALNALTLAFPVQMLMVAFSIGTGVGMNALVAKSLGQKNKEKAAKAAGNAIFLSLIMTLIFVIFGFAGTHIYASSQTSNPEIIQMTVDYLQICCIISFGSVFFAVFEKLLQATGRSAFSTIAQISGAVINIILDPVLIYGYLGLPAMGVKGAAYATVIGQIVSFLTGLFFHLRHNHEINNNIRYIIPSMQIIKEIYSIGLPAIIAQALMSFMTYGLNIIFGMLDEAVVTAYGLYYKIQQFLLFAAFGLRDAITPIISFNYGAKEIKRVKLGIRYGLMYTLIIMTAGLIVFEIFAVPLSAVFGLSGKTQKLCIDAIRIVSLSFLFAGANVAFQGIFQALDGGRESLIISICRQFLFVLPIAYGFCRLAQNNASLTWTIWTTFIIAEGISVLIAIFFMKRLIKKRL